MRHPLTSNELEFQRLIAHIDRMARVDRRRFLAEPELQTGWPDFQDSRSDAIGIVQREARAQSYDPARFDQHLREMLAKEGK